MHVGRTARADAGRAAVRATVVASHERSGGAVSCDHGDAVCRPHALAGVVHERRIDLGSYEPAAEVKGHPQRFPQARR